MKANNKALRNLKGLAIALACAAFVQTARTEPWIVDVNPSNGFGGRTDLWDLNQAGTIYAEWDVFGSATFDNSPDIGSFGLGSASVTENTGGAFLTSGGNIYSPTVAADFTTTLAGSLGSIDGTRTVVARIKTLGSLIADSSVTLTVNGTPYTPTGFLLSDVPLGGFGGNDQERLYVWNSVPDGSYTFDFNASESSMSLGRYATYASDVAPIPEPSTCVLFGIASAFVLYVVRRRRGASCAQQA